MQGHGASTQPCLDMDGYILGKYLSHELLLRRVHPECPDFYPLQNSTEGEQNHWLQDLCKRGPPSFPQSIVGYDVKWACSCDL